MYLVTQLVAASLVPEETKGVQSEMPRLVLGNQKEK
jgi:hypothetical protein